MALSLYSSDLSGLVLLVDDRLSAYTGMEKEFLRVSQRAAELHFARADRQLEAARATFHSHAATWRQRVRSPFNPPQPTMVVEPRPLRPHLTEGLGSRIPKMGGNASLARRPPSRFGILFTNLETESNLELDAGPVGAFATFLDGARVELGSRVISVHRDELASLSRFSFQQRKVLGRF